MSSDPDEAAMPEAPAKFVLIDVDSGKALRPRRFMHTDHTPRTKGDATISAALGVPADNVELFDTPHGDVGFDAASTLGVMGVGKHLKECLSPNGTTMRLFYRVKKPPARQHASDDQLIRDSSAHSNIVAGSSGAVGPAGPAGSAGTGSAADAPVGTRDTSEAKAGAQQQADSTSQVKRKRRRASRAADELAEEPEGEQAHVERFLT
jgi:hypothetical protein